MQNSTNKKDTPLELTVIIVSYNTVGLLSECLSSVTMQKGVNHEVIIVDNASTDGSPQMVSDAFKSFKLICNNHNLGFSRANNQALKLANGRLILFLNPDTQVTQHAFSASIRYMESHSAVGLAGTRIINPDGSPQNSVEYRYPGQQHSSGELANLPGNIAWVSGAAIIAHRHVIDQIGGFDERFFLYAEEVDLCLAARKKGWEVGYIEDAVIVHWGGQSENHTAPYSLWEKKLSAELTFYKKHYTPSTIRSIARSSLAQAYWRIFSLGLILPFSSNKNVVTSKMAKYKAVVSYFSSAMRKL